MPAGHASSGVSHPPRPTFTIVEALHLPVIAVMCVFIAMLPPPAHIRLWAWFGLLLVLTLAVPWLSARAGEAVRHAVAGAVLLSVYETLGGVIRVFGAPLRDNVAVAADSWLTRGLVPPLRVWPIPAAAVDGFAIAYASYFVLPLALVTLLLRRGDVERARESVFTILIAFYLHYIIYMAVPVVGPLRGGEVPDAVRASLLSQGGAVTHLLRAFMAAAEKTPQDGFPSAHTSVACLIAGLAWQCRLRSWPAFAALAAAVTASTIVLGYHYVIDVIAAWPMAWLAWRLAGAIASPHRYRDARLLSGNGCALSDAWVLRPRRRARIPPGY